MKWLIKTSKWYNNLPIVNRIVFSWFACFIIRIVFEFGFDFWEDNSVVSHWSPNWIGLLGDSITLTILLKITLWYKPNDKMDKNEEIDLQG